ncbi:MAG: right-handed parallel beta-helix repeat-containing protein [Ilumatobacteraceae bacterium]
MRFRQLTRLIAVAAVAVPVQAVLAPVAFAAPSVYKVTSNSADAGVSGSLPWAVAQANAHPGFDYIRLPQIDITLSSTLVVTDPVSIDTTVVGEHFGSPGMSYSVIGAVIRGSAGAPDLIRLEESASGSNIDGLTLLDFTGTAIDVKANSSWMQYNQIGYTASVDTGSLVFTMASPITLGSVGIALHGFANSVRGNGIAGVGTGISVESSFNSISINSIGAEYRPAMCCQPPEYLPIGTIHESFDGIRLSGAAQVNWVTANRIRYAGRAGVWMDGPGVGGNVLFSNEIVRNQLGAVAVGGANGNSIGMSVQSPNIFYENPGGGIILGWQGFGSADNNFVVNNTIGLQYAGRPFSEYSARANDQYLGIAVIGSRGNSITGNLIAGMQFHGIALIGSTANEVSGNSIGGGPLLDQTYSGYTGISPNGGYGVLVQDSPRNWIGPNNFSRINAAGKPKDYRKANTLGNVGVFGASPGNVRR